MGYFDAYLEAKRLALQAQQNQPAPMVLQGPQIANVQPQQYNAQQNFDYQPNMQDMGAKAAIALIQDANSGSPSMGDGLADGAYVRDASGKLVPAKLRDGEKPLTTGAQEEGGLKGIGLAEINPTTGLPSIDYNRLVSSLLKKRPELANNPQELLTAVNTVKTLYNIPEGNPAQAVEMARLRLENDPKNIQAKAAASAQGEQQGKTAGQAPKAKNAMEDLMSSMQSSLDFIDQAKTQASNAAKNTLDTGTGFTGQLIRNVGGTSSYDLGKVVSTIQANIGFDKLQKMRDDSPTGSALGRVTNQEITMLTNVVASLDPNQSAEQFNQHLDIAKTKIQSSMQRIAQAYKMTYGSDMPQSVTQSSIAAPSSSGDGWGNLQVK